MEVHQKRVLLAYSGGLDTSIILKWLIEQGFEVLCFMADVGQITDFHSAEKKALGIGAKKFLALDLREEFVKEFVWPCIRANAIYDNRYLLGTSMARPCIARAQVELAKKEGCAFVAHGCTGKGNDQVRFELSYYALQPSIKVIAPWRQKEFLQRFKGRPDLLQYAKENGIPVSATVSAPYSEDDNLFHISHESGILEDPSSSTPESVYSWTKSPETSKATPDEVEIEFKDGTPIKVTNLRDGTTKSNGLELFLYLNQLGSEHGIGRLDMVENRFVGIKSRGVYETPAGTILREAHLDIEGIAQDREVNRLQNMLSSKFSELVYNGFWFSPEMEFLLHCFQKSQQSVNGSVVVQLLKGRAFTLSRKTPRPLYNKDLVSFDHEGGFNPLDSEGFIKINAIRLKAHHVANQGANDGLAGGVV